RIRRPRPRVSPVGRRRPALARARSRRRDLPASPARCVAAARPASGGARGTLCGACGRGDAPREDACPARASSGRRRCGGSAPGDRRLDRRSMSGALLWMLVGIGVTVVVVKRRSVAVALVTAQALTLAGVALNNAGSAGDVVAAGALA